MKTIKANDLAKKSSGFSGADIKNMVNLAILNAIKNNRNEAAHSDFEFALDRISMGVGRSSMLISQKDKELTAYHEGGHALTALLTEGSTPIHKVTILPRGGALGFTSLIPETDQLNLTKKMILAQIDVAMGGRAAEELLFGNQEISTGCSNDLQKATEMAY